MNLLKSVIFAFAIGVPSTILAEVDDNALTQYSESKSAQVLKSFIAGAEYRVAATCFKTGESTSGMNKICYYDCLGSPAAITISSTSLCPLSINQ